MIRPDIFVIAGESSGDLHSAQLIKDIFSLKSNLKVYGIGGPRLKERGVKILLDYSEINYIGFVNIAKNYFYLKDKINQTAKKIIELSPKAIILCDFPGFNLRIAKLIRSKYKGNIYYYITPQVWAWHKSRVKQLRKYTDECFTILPFEKDLLLKEGIKAFYTGSPVLRQCEEFLLSAKKNSRGNKVVSIMPGTRKEEIERILPQLIKIGKILSSKFNCDIQLIGADNISEQYYYQFLNNSRIKFARNNLRSIFDSDFVITKFGTSNLECAFLNVPFASVYKASFLNYLIAKSIVNLNYVSLVNIVMNKKVVKEFIQREFTTKNVIDEAEKIFFDSDYRNKMLSEFIILKKSFHRDIINPAEYIAKSIE